MVFLAASVVLVALALAIYFRTIKDLAKEKKTFFTDYSWGAPYNVRFISLEAMLIMVFSGIGSIVAGLLFISN
ncbi:hypothetical protein Shin27_0880 [Escherichia coli phage Shin27]|uniref:ABC transporter permease n=1 Tax=Salmonella phage KKP_3822 TaxID=3027681 RepID=A0AAX4NCM0_9CAUD|nr:hypothetical protein Shin27_0880 [Escherichia coli phage Shin27]BEU76452.1 hypothetical protein Wa28E_0870 [Escherichia coli phage Wa28]